MAVKCIPRDFVCSYWLLNSEDIANEIIYCLSLKDATITNDGIKYMSSDKYEYIDYGKVVVRRGIEFEVMTEVEFLKNYIQV